MTENRIITLKDWAEEDKPREKMIEKGRKELSNAELLGILLGSGSVGQTAVELGKEILADNGNSLFELSQRSIPEILKYKGIGPAKAVTINAAMELARRLQSEEPEKVQYIGCSSDIFKIIAPIIIDLPHEEFWAIYLNNRNKMIGKTRISVGGLTDTAVDIRLIFKNAVEKNAVGIAVAHNHPSGHTKPSSQDNILTKKIETAGQTLNIKLIDHIIVGLDTNGKEDYYSYYDNGDI